MRPAHDRARIVTLRTPFQGGCCCGAIRYECSAAPLGMVNCHCRDCQLAGGSAYSPTVVVGRGAIAITKGRPQSFEKVADSGHRATREFCPSCGTPLFAFSSASPDRIGVRATTLDEPGEYSPDADVWVTSAQPWDCLICEIPKFEKSRSG